MEEIAPEPKKRGRKVKDKTSILNSKKNDAESTVNIPKKRGRKPKGGKIITVPSIIDKIEPTQMNIILHLKCKRSDIVKLSEGTDDYESYIFKESKTADLNYVTLSTQEVTISEKPEVTTFSEDKTSMRQISSKLDQLAKDLHTNNVCDKKSACFWCTEDFDNPPIYIPKYELNGSYHVYGCFCSPECACSYLMNEGVIDDATRFERYSLLNFIYSKIYNYEKNIKPAPNPFYTLDKYYGNLSIQEYRKLLTSERLLLVVDKPLTRILPELYYENEDSTFSNQALGGKYSLRRSSRPLCKNTILNDQFNLGS